MVCTFLKAFLQACFVCWKLRTWKTCAVLTRRVFHGRLTEREREREMEGGMREGEKAALFCPGTGGGEKRDERGRERREG